MHPDELIGLWDSAPFDFGALEATRLALLADGHGWSELANAAGARNVRRLTWDEPRPGVIELRYALAIDVKAGGAHERDYEFIRARYTVIGEAEGEAVLRLSELVDFARRFALRKRNVAMTDDPSHDLVPYEESSPGPVS